MLAFSIIERDVDLDDVFLFPYSASVVLSFVLICFDIGRLFIRATFFDLDDSRDLAVDGAFDVSFFPARLIWTRFTLVLSAFDFLIF